MKRVLGIMNLDGSSVRHEMFEGRRHLVAPVVLMVEGVHRGAAGAYFYPASELSQFAVAWNGRPLPVFHPREGGDYVTANDPQIIEEWSVGQLFNVRFNSDVAKLVGEVWIDEEKARTLSPEVLSLVQGGRRLEVSTGLYSDDDGTPGTWNGEEYKATIRNIRPDHLALLPGGVGACSWEDGCGVRASARGTARTPHFSGTETTLRADVRELLNKHFDTEPEVNEPMKKEPLPSRLMESLGLKMLISARKLGLTDNEASHEEMRARLQRAVDALDNEGWLHFVRAVYDSFFVYEARGNNPSETGASRVSKMYKRGYSVNEDSGEVTLANNAQEVREEINYVPVANADSTASDEGEQTNEENVDMKKNDIIQALIACPHTNFDAEDESWLNNLETEQLEKLRVLEPPTKPSAPEPSADNESPKPSADLDSEDETKLKTLEEFVEGAPAEYRDHIQRALRRDADVKTKLVDVLVANERCSFSVDELKSKGLDELERLVELARVEVDFSGQGGGPDTQVDDGSPDPMPSVFELKKETA
jgi:hypothetical protein